MGRYNWLGMITERSQSLVAIVLAAAAFLVRLPLCFAGPGFDQDSALVLKKAMLSVLLDKYVPSRGPGYIIPDHIGHLLAPYGWIYLNILSNFLHSLTIPLFARILDDLKTPNRLWGLTLYAFFPMHIIGYSDVMIDYPLMMLGILLGWWLLNRGNPSLAAASVGIGAAMRPSQGVFFILILAFFVVKRFGWKTFGYWLGISVLMLLSFWIIPALLLADYKLIISYLPYPFEIVQYMKHIFLRFVGPIGIFPLIVLSVGIIVNWKIILENTKYNYNLLVCIITSLIFLMLFFRHPFKSNYLLAMIPFCIYLICISFSERLIKILVFSSVIHGVVAVPSTPPCSPLKPFGEGIIISEYRDRVSFAIGTSRLLTDIPPKSTVLCGPRTIDTMSYNILKDGVQGYEIDIKRNAIHDKKQDRWWIHFRPEIVDYIKTKKLLRYKIFTTDSLYRRYRGILEQAGILESAHRLDTSRCQ